MSVTVLYLFVYFISETRSIIILNKNKVLHWSKLNILDSPTTRRFSDIFFVRESPLFFPPLFRGWGVGWGVFLFVSRRKWLHTDEALIHQVQSHHRTALPRCTPSTIKTPKSSLCPEATGAPALVQPHQWDPGSWEADMLQPKFKLIFSVSCKRFGGGGVEGRGELGRAHVSGRHRLLSLLFFLSFSLTSVSRTPCRCPISFSRQSKQIPEIQWKSSQLIFFHYSFYYPSLLDGHKRTNWAHECVYPGCWRSILLQVWGASTWPFSGGPAFPVCLQLSIQLQSQHQPDTTEPQPEKGSTPTHIFHLLHDTTRATRD